MNQLNKIKEPTALAVGELIKNWSVKSKESFIKILTREVDNEKLTEKQKVKKYKQEYASFVNKKGPSGN